MNTDILKEQLIQLLRGGNAYRPLRDLLANFPQDKINKKIPGVSYTPYHLMEHIRIAQWDILEFIKNQDHKSPNWPEGYWPDKSYEANTNDWDKSVKQFFNDLNEIENIVNDEQLNLTDSLPKADDYNYIREVFLVAAHNSYHVGQLVVLSKSE